jgi:hypothetical protein
MRFRHETVEQAVPPDASSLPFGRPTSAGERRRSAARLGTLLVQGPLPRRTIVPRASNV